MSLHPYECHYTATTKRLILPWAPRGPIAGDRYRLSLSLSLSLLALSAAIVGRLADMVAPRSWLLVAAPPPAAKNNTTEKHDRRRQRRRKRCQHASPSGTQQGTNRTNQRSAVRVHRRQKPCCPYTKGENRAVHCSIHTCET